MVVAIRKLGDQRLVSIRHGADLLNILGSIDVNILEQCQAPCKSIPALPFVGQRIAEKRLLEMSKSRRVTSCTTQVLSVQQFRGKLRTAHGQRGFKGNEVHHRHRSQERALSW